jgi:tetratricopeptide (TPR) repeat protein
LSFWLHPPSSGCAQYLSAGQQNLEYGLFSAALSNFDQAIVLNSELAGAWDGKAIALRQLGRYEEANVAYEKATVLRMNSAHNSAEFWIERGCSQFDTGDFEGALFSYNKAVEICPNHAKSWANRGAALFALAYYEEAIANLSQAIALEADCEFAWINRGAALIALGHHEKAITDLDKALTLKPNCEAIWTNRATALENLERYEEAIANYDKAIEIKPNSYQAWNSRGTALAALGCYEKAIDNYNQAVKFKMDFCEAWNNRGLALAQLERYEEAINSFDKAIEIEQDYLEAWHNRGFMLGKVERHEEAVSSFDRVIRLNPDDYEAWRFRSIALSKLGRYEDAVDGFNIVIEIKVDHYEAWYERGTILVELELYEDAIVSFDVATSLKVDYYEAWFARGNALFYLDRYKDSVDSFSQAVKFKVDYYEAWCNRSMVLIMAECYEDAITSYDQALIHFSREMQPEGWGELYRGKGDVYRYQAQYTQTTQTSRSRYYLQSLKCYQTALQTLENFPESYLGLIQGLIKTYLSLANFEAAKQWRIKGLEVFRELLNAQSAPQEKRKIEVQFSVFSQVDVDVLLSAGNFVTALENAERYKNRCLTWILEEWQEKIISPSYVEMQQLLDSNHEIVYWHLSEETLTTFILKSNQESPIVLTHKSTQFKAWQKEWDKRYGDYRSKRKDKTYLLPSHPWRDTLDEELARLKSILKIDEIEAKLSPETQLILIPHRDLHRFPIHALFENSVTTYLPSIQVGLTQKTPTNLPSYSLLNIEDPARSDQLPLEFAYLESSIIHAMFPSNVKTIHSQNADRATVETSLQEGHNILHFTGHGSYNARQPEYSTIGLADTDHLTAKEISVLNLRQYELVCLSACETALVGTMTISTEYVGLTSAFLQAGVSQIISTLWQVYEISNAYLMIRFYQFLKDGISPAEALKKSQCWLRTSTNLELAAWLLEISRIRGLDALIKQELEKQAENFQDESNNSTMDSQYPPYADPYHWAAFTLTGRGSL